MPDVGPIVARGLRDFFDSPENRRVIDRLLELGVHPTAEAPPEPPAGSMFAGKTVVFTGKLERFTREEGEEIVRRLGGKASKSVSKKTDLLVAGPGAGSKRKKAEELGIEITDEDGFLALVGEEAV